jgi:two-component system response regulator NreC
METTDEIQIVMADDHEIFRDGFRLILSRAPGIKLLAEAGNGRELVELVKTHHPHVVITDIKMPIMDGIEAARAISKQWPHIGIIGLSMFDEEDLIIDMLEAGAKGYLVKNADKAEVIEAIKTVYMQQNFYCRQTSSKMAHIIGRKFRPEEKKEKLEFSEKELEIIKLICEEYTNKEISDIVFLSVRTVEGYRQKILDKMNVKNTVGLVVYAIQHKLYDPGES